MFINNTSGHKNIKLLDIAEELNISVVSVSNALSGKKGVSDELRQKVFDVAEELGYRKINKENHEQKNKQYTIGVCIAEKYLKKQGLSFYMVLYQKIVLAVSKKNSITFLEILGINDEEKFKIPNLLYSRELDGIIILGEMKDPYTQILKQESKIPIVFLDYYKDMPDTDFIISDGYNGMYKMTRLLIEEGYKKIGFVGNIGNTSSITDRFLGYKKAMLKFGLEINENWIIKEEKFEDMLIHIILPEEMPEAFVCNCDRTANILIDELEKNGYQVPKDIGIVGFDNYSSESRNNIKLTTYDVDMDAIAQIGVNTIIRKIEHTYFIQRLRIVTGKIIMGESHIK